MEHGRIEEFGIGRCPHGPGLRLGRQGTLAWIGRALLGSVGQAAVSHYSFETLELFREAMARLSRERVAARLQTNDSQPLEISTYTIELRFNHLARQVEHQLDAF
jgi:hypothetical protein